MDRSELRELMNEINKHRQAIKYAYDEIMRHAEEVSNKIKQQLNPRRLMSPEQIHNWSIARSMHEAECKNHPHNHRRAATLTVVVQPSYFVVYQFSNEHNQINEHFHFSCEFCNTGVCFHKDEVFELSGDEVMEAIYYKKLRYEPKTNEIYLVP